MPDGRVLRPTLALLDDVQDRSVAKSAVQVADTIEIINGDVAGMGEAGTNLPILMSGNCIARGDVMEHYLDSERWKSIRVSCVDQWPDGWKDGEGKTAEIWKDWHALYQAGKGATTFYRKNKAVMTKNFRLSAPGTFRRVKGLSDAFCGVMLSYFKMGPEAFAAESQQMPLERTHTLYALTPQLVQSRVDKNMPPGQLPEWAEIVIAATDINPSYALTSVVVAFGANQRAAVVWYGLHPMSVPKEATQAVLNKTVHDALSNHGRTLAALPCRPKLWCIDARGVTTKRETNAVNPVKNFTTVSGHICGLVSIACFGAGWRDFRPRTSYAKTCRPGEELYFAQNSSRDQWLRYNADYWREVSQRGWTGEPGSPGSCSLPAGKHSEFADQVCREQLTGKAEVGGRTVWVWNTVPSQPHDFGDAMHMAYMGAAYSGYGTGGQPKREKKKANVVIGRRQ